MKDNGKCALTIRQALIVIIAIFVLATTAAVIKNIKSGVQIAQGDVQEEVKVGKIEIINTNEPQEEIITEETYEREYRISTRSEAERKTQTIQVAKAVVHYKTIDEVTISRDMDLTIPCGLSREDFIILMTGLKRDTSGFFERNAGLIYDLCQKYELNEIFFCGLIAGESGWNIASNHRNTHNYISMMSGGKLIRYSSDEEGLEAAAKLLHNRYLTPGGSYYRGKTLSAMQKIFCPNSSTWVGLIYTCMSQIV